jgi:DNA-binding response OmpR family regulator
MQEEYNIRRMKTAWHIDDDQDMINAIALMMQLLDYEVRPFLNAPAAAEALAEGGKPDLFLLDINMPQVSGMDMLEFIRRDKAYKDVPVVMLTSESTDAQEDEALDMGADAYVTKPATYDELERGIYQAIRRRQQT